MQLVLRGRTLVGVCLVAVAALGADAPRIIWASQPVRPDETLVLAGEGFTAESVVGAGTTFTITLQAAR